MRRISLKVFFLSFFFLILTLGYLPAYKSEEYPKQHSVLPLTDSLIISDTLSFKDSCITVAAGTHYQHSGVYTFFYGKHYRDLWALPIEVNVFDIGSVNGGLKINKKGGGLQTRSLRMTAHNKKKYVLRSIDKDQSRILPSWLQKTFIRNIIQDQISAQNPYGALVIPKLSDAAGLLHTNPVLYFIPYDGRFGEYSKEFEGRLFFLEENPDSSWAGSELFGYPNYIIGSEYFFEKYFKQQNVKVDDRMLAKARLFDLWIGDWDRHTTQWKWAEYRSDSLSFYKPVAKDRDMAFCKYGDGGILMFFAQMINNKLQTFDYKYGNMKGLEKNATYLDHVFLNSLTKQDLLLIADSLKQNLSDGIIEEAVSVWPEEVYKKVGAEYIAKLKSRRDHLNEAAEKFYNIISQEATITGTDMIETIEVLRMDDNRTSVQIFNEDQSLRYSRIFLTQETEKIKIYALKGNDKISLTGVVKKGIEIEIFGGEGNDMIADHSHVNGFSRKTIIYDSKEGNRIEFGKESSDKTSDDPSILEFDRIGERKR